MYNGICISPLLSDTGCQRTYKSTHSSAMRQCPVHFLISQNQIGEFVLSGPKVWLVHANASECIKIKDNVIPIGQPNSLVLCYIC
jgi:hypothetical protein